MSGDIISGSHLLSRLKWRYAVQQFDSVRKITPDVWSALEHALVLTPSSFNLQPWKFFIVHDPDLRIKLRAASWNQPQITDASHLVVFAIKRDLGPVDADRHIQRVAEVQNVSLESLSRQHKSLTKFVSSGAYGLDLNVWAAKQVYIALGNFLTCAAMLGVDACPMEGLDPKQYDTILGIDTQGYHTVCAAAAGYRDPNDPDARLPKVRFPLKDVIHHI